MTVGKVVLALMSTSVLVVFAACSSDDSASISTVGTSTESASTTTAHAVAPTLTTLSTSTSGAAAPVQTKTIEPSAKIELVNPDWLAADEQYVYTRLDSSEVVRLNPATGEVLGITDVGGLPCRGLGAAYGAVWSCVAQGDEPESIVRIDPATDQVIATIELGKSTFQGSLVGGFDRVWVLVADGSLLVGIDPITNAIDEPIDLGVIGYELAVGSDAVWVISNRDHAVVRVDPTSRTVTDRIDVTEPVAIDASAAVWVGTADSTVRIDPTSLGVTELPIPVGYGGTVEVHEGDVWIRSAARFVERIDAATGEVVEQFDAGVASGGDLMIAFDAVWATAFDDYLLVRQPL